MAFSSELTQKFSLKVQRTFSKTQRTPRNHPSTGHSPITLNVRVLLSEHAEIRVWSLARQCRAQRGGWGWRGSTQELSPGQQWLCHVLWQCLGETWCLWPQPQPDASASPARLMLAPWLCSLHKQTAHLRKNKEPLVKGVRQKLETKKINTGSWKCHSAKTKSTEFLRQPKRNTVVSVTLPSARLQVLKSVRGRLCT